MVMLGGEDTSMELGSLVIEPAADPPVRSNPKEAAGNEDTGDECRRE